MAEGPSTAAEGHYACLFSALAPQCPGPADCTDSYNWIGVARSGHQLTASPGLGTSINEGSRVIPDTSLLQHRREVMPGAFSSLAE